VALKRSDYGKIPVRPKDDYYVGLDIGQSVDPSAVAVLNHVVVAGEEWTPDDKARLWRQAKTERFLVRHLERLPLQMPYPQQIQHVANLLSRDPLHGATFALDYTGCGRPVADMFDRAGLRSMKILITGGNEVTRHERDVWHFPKGHLVSQLEARMQSGELRFAADLLEAPALKEELKDFSRKVSETGRVTYNARSGKHDDLVLSICCALAASLHRTTSSAEPFRV
jgi:hypothetical protein